MKSFPLVLFFIFCLFDAVAQIDDYYVDFVFEKPSKIKKFYIDSIIDKRLFKSNIGFVNKGIGNKQFEAKLAGGVSKCLKRQFDVLIPPGNGEPITLLIHHFQIHEIVKSTKESGVFTAKIEFLKQRNGNYYSIWSKDIKVEDSKFDVTKSHKDRIEFGLKTILLDFYNSNKIDISGKQIDFSNKLDSINLNVLPKKGFYSNLYDLNLSKPLPAMGFKLKKVKKGKLSKYFLINNKGQKKFNDILFACDGKNIYMNAKIYSTEQHFIRSKELGRYIYFEDKYVKNPTNTALAFGAIGLAISNNVKAIILDKLTGNIYRLNTKGKNNFLSQYPEIAKKYNRSEKKLEHLQMAIAQINKKYK